MKEKLYWKIGFSKHAKIIFLFVWTAGIIFCLNHRWNYKIPLAMSVLFALAGLYIFFFTISVCLTPHRIEYKIFPSLKGKKKIIFREDIERMEIKSIEKKTMNLRDKMLFYVLKESNSLGTLKVVSIKYHSGEEITLPIKEEKELMAYFQKYYVDNLC